MKNNLYKKSIAFMVIFLLLTNLILPIVYATGDEEIEFKDSEFEKAILDNGRDLNWESIDKDENGKISKQEMESLYELSVSCIEISSIDDLKYAKNLKLISLYNYESNLDLSVIKQLTGLLNFDISGNNILMSNIIDVVSSLPNLESLGVGNYNENGLDIKELVPICSNISELNLSGNIKNINALAQIPKLKSLNLRNNSENPTIDEIINVIKNMELTNVCIGSEINVNLGTFHEGENVVKSFSEISPVMNYVFDETNCLYSPESCYDSGYDNIQIDNNKKTVTISTNNNVGEQYSNIYCNGGKFCGNIYLSWKVIPQGDTETEIPIPDNNLKQIILNNYDVDDNKKITEIDLKSIETINITDWEKPVSNIEGLQYMTNLKNLYINNNTEGKIDLTPIYKLKNLENISISFNGITDISFLLNYDKLITINLINNPINPNDENNKKVIEELHKKGVQIELSEFDDSKIINFVNTKLKEQMVKSGRYTDLNGDGEISEYEMSKVYSLYNVQGKLDDLKYTKNLHHLSISVNEETESIEPILNNKELENLQIFTNYGNVQNKTLDISNINKFSNLTELMINESNSIQFIYTQLPSSLKKLSISNYNKKIDLSNFSNLKDLEILNINSNKIENFDTIKNFSKIKELTISINTTYYSQDGPVDEQNIDISKIEPLTQLEKLELYGKMSNYASLKKLAKLKELRISSYNDKDLNIDEMMNVLNQLNVDKLNLSGNYRINLGNIDLGKKVEDIKIEDLCSITKAIYTKENKLYIENPKWKTYGNGGMTTVENQIKIDTSKVGSNSFWLQLDGLNSKFSGSFSIVWNVVEDGDKTKEINIPDENFRKELLERYDIDNNEKITEYDLINIRDLEIGNKNIKSIEGIQNFKNVSTIYAWGNQIVDLTPITKLENIVFADFSKNEIQNIDCLENAIVPLNRLVLDNNYIKTSKGSKAYNILKKAYINEMKKHEESAKYINDNDILEQIDDHIIHSQNYGSYEERKLEVNMENAIKQKLLEVGLDKDNNGKLTREELYNADNEIYQLDLSNLGIRDISPLKYINVYSVNLSNNNITDISELANTKFQEINLSNNKINNISVVKDLYRVYRLNLSNNNILNITELVNMPYIRYEHQIEIEAEEMNVYDLYQGVFIDLTQNYIDVNEKNNKNTIEAIDMEKNTIELENQKAKPDSILGDVSGDGKVSLLDYGLVLAHVKKTKLLTGEQLERADVNGDNKVTLLDYGLILAHVKKTKLLF